MFGVGVGVGVGVGGDGNVGPITCRPVLPNSLNSVMWLDEVT